jgi:DNA integrity scanning protein DisA with diadenylate cyclase activity
MDNNLILFKKDSPFIKALVEATEFRRSQVAQGHLVENSADILGNNTEQLAKITNQCFLSSITVEEGRAVKGSICICSPEDALLSRAFQEAVPVSVKAIVALLTASPRSSLAVHNGINGPEIWGVLDSVPMFSLRVRIAAPGVIVASSYQGVVAVLQSGEIHIPKPLNKQTFMGIVAEALNSDLSFPERLMQAELLLRVVVTIYQQGHGGALVVVPNSFPTSRENHISFAYKFKDSSTLILQERLQEFVTANCEAKKIEMQFMMGQATEMPSLAPLHIKAVESYRALLDSTLRSIGDLSAIDGALVMDDTLKVLGFGAKLQNSSLEEFNVISYDPLISKDTLSGVIGEVPITKLFSGTRHQSAARFVKEDNNAMVFVASQDGRLTLFVWVTNDSRVMAVRNLEHCIWDFCQ